MTPDNLTVNFSFASKHGGRLNTIKDIKQRFNVIIVQQNQRQFFRQHRWVKKQHRTFRYHDVLKSFQKPERFWNKFLNLRNIRVTKRRVPIVFHWESPGERGRLRSNVTADCEDLLREV